jgi:hypothetical protein
MVSIDTAAAGGELLDFMSWPISQELARDFSHGAKPRWQRP